MNQEEIMIGIKEQRTLLIRLELQKKGHLESLKNLNKAITEVKNKIYKIATHLEKETPSLSELMKR